MVDEAERTPIVGGKGDRDRRRRRAVWLRWAVVMTGLMVSTIGWILVWRAVDHLHEADNRATQASLDLETLRLYLTDRLDEVLGRTGFHGEAVTEDRELEELLSYIVDESSDPTEVAELTEILLDQEAELHERAVQIGGPNELHLLSMRNTRGELHDAVVRPAWDKARAANVGARRTVAVVMATSTALWALAALASRQPQPPDRKI